MGALTVRRQASIEEIIAEMDRRGRVIEELEQERDQLKAALKLSDADRRQWFISFCLKKFGHFNRGDICNTFGVSVPQASLDIRKWLETNPTDATYNTSSKRYEANASSNYSRYPSPSMGEEGSHD